MAPVVRKSHIEASKKSKPDQQSCVIQYYGKGPVNDQKIIKGIKRWVVQGMFQD